MKHLVYGRRSFRLGFTLMEVNLSVLLISAGLLAIFALFPFAMRESEYSILDTHQAMFADSVLSGIEGNAMAIEYWEDWSMTTMQGGKPVFCAKIESGVYPIDSVANDGVWKRVGSAWVIEKTGIGDDNAVLFPNMPGGGIPRYIRYSLQVTPAGNIRIIELKVASGAYGVFADKQQPYFTQVRYMGM